LQKACRTKPEVQLVEPELAPTNAASSSTFVSPFPATNADLNVRDDPFKLTGATQVAQFLNRCVPPMGHFRQCFIDYGCSNEEYLVAVSTWPTDRIASFLSQVSAHESGERKLSEMDKVVLQNHFISYFCKAQN
jgi:hypothetical protein